jgi:hypothetical protein
MASILSESVIASLLCFGQTEIKDDIRVHYGVKNVRFRGELNGAGE